MNKLNMAAKQSTKLRTRTEIQQPHRQQSQHQHDPCYTKESSTTRAVVKLHNRVTQAHTTQRPKEPSAKDEGGRWHQSPNSPRNLTSRGHVTPPVDLRPLHRRHAGQPHPPNNGGSNLNGSAAKNTGAGFRWIEKGISAIEWRRPKKLTAAMPRFFVFCFGGTGR